MEETSYGWSETEEDEEFSENIPSGQKRYEFRRPAVIYLLDVRRNMFKECNITANAKSNSPAMMSLQCIRHAMQAKIQASQKALCSFVMLGTGNCDNNLGLKNISVIMPLTLLSAEHMLKMDEIIARVNDSSFENEFGFGDMNLGDAFWLSFRIFNDISKNTKLRKTIVLFTNDDNPTQNDRNEFDRVINSAQDMFQNDVLFDLIHIGENFDVNHLFKELIQLSRGDMDYIIPDSFTQLFEMVEHISKVDYQHVPHIKLPFHITDNFKCEVTLHYLVRKAKPPFKVKLSKATNEVVTRKVQYFETETGQVVPKEDLVKTYKFGGKEIALTMTDLAHINSIRSFQELGLRLIGFKPASTVHLEQYVKPCAFIYPSEPENTENSAFFVALLTRCLQRDVVPICTFCPRRTSRTDFVALIANEEVASCVNIQQRLPGFIVFFLPFTGQIRNLDKKCTGKNRAMEEQVHLMKKIIKRCKVKYPVIYPNPKIACHWAAIEALALGKKEVEPVEDYMKIDFDFIWSRVGPFVERFKEMVYKDGYDPERFAGRKKRVRKPLSVASTSEQEFEVDVKHVEELIKRGDGGRLGNNILKKYLQQVGEGRGISKMKKSELLERACTYLNISVPGR